MNKVAHERDISVAVSHRYGQVPCARAHVSIGKCAAHMKRACVLDFPERFFLSGVTCTRAPQPGWRSLWPKVAGVTGSSREERNENERKEDIADVLETVIASFPPFPVIGHRKLDGAGERNRTGRARALPN